MKATVLKDFHDLKEDVVRKAGETFEATRERIDEINKKLGEDFVKAAPFTPRKKKEDSE